MENIINDKDENLNLFNTMQRYPFNGRSKYLIDKFYLIGYEYNSIHKLLIETKIKDIIKEDSKELNNSDFNDLMGNKKIKKEEFKSITFPDSPPILLNEIASDHKKQMPSFDIILNMIFPNGCKFFYSSEEYKEEEDFINLEQIDNTGRASMSSIKIEMGNDSKTKIKKNRPSSYNVVFSYNPQEGKNSKKSIYGFSFIFYKMQNELKIVDDQKYYFYVPYIFCILSEFPFYNSYYILCNHLYNLIKSKKVEIPLEIIIYNIVNFTLSPINSDIILDLGAFFSPHKYIDKKLEEIKENEELEIEQEEEDKDNKIENNNIINNNNLQNNLVNKTQINENHISNKKLKKLSSKNIKKKEDSKEIKVRLMRATIASSILKSKKDKKIKFGFLSGYPLIQYNLVKVLLNKMTPADVITIFFYTFLEKSVIFFSKNIELLSLTIESYLNLNFPLNDEKYYFYNASISFENYVNGNSLFIGTSFTNTIGINCKYNSNYKNKHVKLAEHLTVDLDKGIINQVEDENENNNEEKDENLFNFFKKIFNNKEMKEKEKGSVLYREVKNIFEKLTFYKELFNKKNQKEKKDEYKKVVNGNYIDYDDYEESSDLWGNDEKKKFTIKYINRDIQESFYILINNLCIYFYQNLTLRTNYNSKKNGKNDDKNELMNIIFNDDAIKEEENKYIQEEKDFLSELRETMKFQSFVYGFIQSYNPIDLYKIPLTFTEEFLSMLTTKSNIYYKNKNFIKFLSLIDSVYEKNRKKKVNIEFSQFVNEYFKKYKKILDREIYDIHDEDKLFIITKEKNNPNIDIEGFFYLSYELNNNIIFQYKYLIDNLDKKEYISLLNKQNYINENKIETIMLGDIENSIENYLMKIGILSSNDICCSNIIILFILSMKRISEKFDCQIFLSSLFKQCKIFRKYFTMIIEIIYILMKKSLENKKYEDAETYLMSYYPFINSLRSLGLVPNENLINIIKKFNQITIDDIKDESTKNIINEEKDLKDMKKDNEIDDKQINFEDNYIYLCKNFTYDKFINEINALIYINKPKKETPYSKSILLQNQKGKEFKPKIKFNNRIVNYEFDIISQKDIFEKLSEEYNNYVKGNLIDTFLNAEVIFPLCLNIILYFRNMGDFEGKDEVNFVLKEILILYLNFYQERKNNTKK